jgi:hypothetical protein
LSHDFPQAHSDRQVCRLRASQRSRRSPEGRKGDVVYLTESPDGYRITPYDPASEKQMQAAERIMEKRRNVLRELAK